MQQVKHCIHSSLILEKGEKDVFFGCFSLTIESMRTGGELIGHHSVSGEEKEEIKVDKGENLDTPPRVSWHCKESNVKKNNKD